MPMLFPLIGGSRSRVLNWKPGVTVGIDERDYHTICGSLLDLKAWKNRFEALESVTGVHLLSLT
jgi:hypothetical protein